MTPRWDELGIGTECATREYGPLTRTDIVRYQGASGDMNPLHHDETFARAAGYDAPLAIGMLGAGMLASYAADWLGAANVRRFRIRFRSQAWPVTRSPAAARLCGSMRAMKGRRSMWS